MAKKFGGCGKLIVGLAVALALQAQTPTVIAVSNDRWSSPVVIAGAIGYVVGFNFGTAGNTTVRVGGLDARVLSVSGGQIRVEFPPNLPAGPATLIVAVEGRLSQAMTVMVSASAQGRVGRGEGTVSGGPGVEYSTPHLAEPATLPPVGQSGNIQTAGTGIVYTCDPTITAVSSGACDTLNTTIAGLYSNAFTNTTAQIYLKLGNTNLGHSSYVTNPRSYSQYRNALIAHETDSTDTTAVAASVPASSPFGSDQVLLTNPLARALGMAVTFGFLIDGSTFCSLGPAGCYDGVITVTNAQPLYFRSGSIGSNEYDFFTVVEHETDEILGTFSCSPNSCGANYFSPPDLYRYHSDATRSFATGTNDSCSSGDSTNACFSIDGVHMLQQYNNLSNGEDTGDWVNGCVNPLVQDASLCSGVAALDISPAAEILVLDAIGYTLNNPAAVTSVTTSTANGIYGAGTSISIHVTFTAAVTVAGSPQLALNSGGTATYSSGSGSGTLTFVYLVAAGQNSALLDYTSVNALTLSGGTITGPGGLPILVLPSPGAAGSLSASANIVINTSTGSVTVHTSPSGLQFSVDGGAAQTAPQTLTLTQGTHTIAVVTTQAGSAGTQYVFTGWNNSVSASDSISVAAGAASYTASFKTQYQLTLSASPPVGGTVAPASGSFYDSGIVVTVDATPGAGDTFAGWTGSVASAGSASTTVTMNGPLTVSASFLKPLLSVALAHSGNFSQQQLNATYTATVSNATGAGSTSGTVTLTEILPAGLALVSMAGGTSWNCPTGGAACTRSDVLKAGNSFPAITVTVNVASNAPSQVTNQVTVSGGTSANAQATDVTSISPFSKCDILHSGNFTVADVQSIVNQGLGTFLAVNDLNADGVVNVVDVQIEISAVLTLSCGAK